MAQVADLVHARTGLVFPEARTPDVEATIRRTMQRRGLDDPQRLVELLRRDAHVRESLVAELTIGESYFMRDPAQFDVLRHRIFPELLSARADGTPIRLWSAGCAMGEEPYSMAMLLEELGWAKRAYILGTDIARPRLEDAQRGIYSRWALRVITDATRERYFHPRGRYFELTARIRQRVDFRYLNLAEDTYPSLSTGIWGLDVIFCRNVLIYFDAPTVARVARRLIAALSSDGWLVLAASDPPLSELVECDVVETEAGYVYRRPGHASGVAPHGRTSEPVIDARISFALPEHEQREHEPETVPWAEPESPPMRPQPAVPQDSDVVTAYEARDFERVKELAARVHAARPPSETVWMMWVRALANGGELSEAMRASTRALAAGSTAELLYLHAVLLLQAGRVDEAASAARRALYLDRKLVVAHMTLADAQRRAGDAEGARRSLRNARRLLTQYAPEELVPASDGETAGRLKELVSVRLRLLGAVQEATE